MNRLSHMVFALSLFVGIYSLVYTWSVWQSDLGQLMDLAPFYIGGGLLLSIIAVPILYYKAPHKGMSTRTTSNRSAVGAMTFVTFTLGSLIGTVVYSWYSGVTSIGEISIFIGVIMTMTGALVPDWDIPFLGISRHRNIVFHSVILPLLVTLMTILNVTWNIIHTGSLTVGANVEYYITALFLLGYASHLYLDIFPSDSSPLEIIWRASDPTQKAPTGMKSLGPIKISKKYARGWLVGNATVLVVIALALLGIYFYNVTLLTP